MESLHFPLEQALPIYSVLAFMVIVVPILSEKLRIPSIVGLILTGILLGHSATNLIADSQVVQLPATIGLLYLMFLAGLEIDIEIVRKRFSHSLGFGIVTFALSFLIGYEVADKLLHMNSAGNLLMGVMLASHTLITLPLITRYGLSKTGIVSTVIGGTIVTEILAILILALVAGETKGSLGLFFAIRLGVFLLFAIAAMQWIIPTVGRWFFAKVSSDPGIEYAFVITVFFSFSFFAELAGLENIIGAILAGMSLNRLIPENSALMHRVKFVGEALFIPVFLISVGLIIDLHHLLSAEHAWIIAGVLILSAVITKYVSAWITALIFSYTKPERRLLFGMSISRVTVTLAAVLVGFNLEIFPAEVMGGTVFMILITAVLGPILTRASAEKLVIAEESSTGQLKEQPQRILIAVKSEQEGSRLVDFALLLRNRNSHEPIHPLNIVQEGADPDTAVARAEKLMTSAVIQASSAEIPVVPLARIDSTVQNGILRAMLDQRISILVAGWDGEGSLYGSSYGKHLDSVLNESRQMVFISHVTRPLNSCRRIILVVPPMVHKLEGFRTTLQTIKNLGSQLQAQLHILTSGDAAADIKSTLEEIKPSVQAVIESYTSLPHVLENIDRLNVKEFDLVMMMSVRIGHMSWQPRLERLPSHLCRRFRHHNIVIIFTPHSPEVNETILDVSGAEEKHGLFSGKNSTIVRTRNPLSQDIGTILSPLSLPDHLLRQLEDELVEIAGNEPVELKPGIVLLHTHIEHIQNSLLVMGINEEGFEIPKVPDTRILIILIGPKLQSPEEHLQTLAAIATEVRAKDFPAFEKTLREN